MSSRSFQIAIGVGAALLGQTSVLRAQQQIQKPRAVANDSKIADQKGMKVKLQMKDPKQVGLWAWKEEFVETKLGQSFLKNLARDQKAIWQSPSKIRFEDTFWILPLGGLTGVLLANDRKLSSDMSNDTHTLNKYRKASNWGAASLVGGAGGLFLWGQITHDDHRRETGLLAGEALLNSLALSTTIQYATGRARPLEGGGSGNFGRGGTSFPSNHAAAVWSLASVIAHEYPGPLTKILAYGMASAVSVSRVRAKEHFPSDVVIGSAIGWFVGQQVYRAHHNPGLRGSTWATPAEALSAAERETHGASASTFVPLDSWVYSVIERLAGMGYVRSGMSGLKPYTRVECARLTEEASEQIHEMIVQDRAPSESATILVAELEKEFAYEMDLLGGGANRNIQLESIYSRATSISGPPLTDALHFGQTISYDFGRPFRRGFNSVTGGAFFATAGRFGIYVRGEFQHSPSAPALSTSVSNLIAQMDLKPIEQPHPFETLNRARLLDAYITLNLGNWQFSVGKQSMEWGVGEGNSLLLSHNAEPIPMFRLTRVLPQRLPSILKWLGPVRTESFWGQLDGLTLADRPFFYGQKIVTKPHARFELGYGRTTIFGGGLDPVNLRSFAQSYFGSTNKQTGTNPGDTRTSLDFSWLLPGTKDSVSLYAELFQEDDTAPFQRVGRSAWRPGLYLSKIPGVSKLDFRIEAASTESPRQHPSGGAHFNYWNFQYHDGYQQLGVLLGNTVGRMGRTIQASSRYSFSPSTVLEVRYKYNAVDQEVFPGGAIWRDFSVQQRKHFRGGVYLRGGLQVERIQKFPVLFTGSQTNVVASMEIGFLPERKNP